MSKGTNRNFDARITLEQLLALYTDPESHNAQRHRQTDGRTDGRTDNRLMPRADHTVYDRLKMAATKININLQNMAIPHTLGNPIQSNPIYLIIINAMWLFSAFTSKHRTQIQTWKRRS